VNGYDTRLRRGYNSRSRAHHGPEGLRTAYKPPRRPAAPVLPRSPSQSLGGLPLMERRGARSRFVAEPAASCHPRESESWGHDEAARNSRESCRTRRTAASLEEWWYSGCSRTRVANATIRCTHLLAALSACLRSALRPITRAPHPTSPRKRRGEEAAGAIVATRKLGIGMASSPFAVEPAALGAPSPRLFAGRGEVRGLGDWPRRRSAEERDL
jgi:hypothetical protein